MNYILNTKTKKIEIFWDTQEEYRALINFVSNFSITEEQNSYVVKTPEFGHPSITWATNNLPNSYTICDGGILNGTITSKAETALYSNSVDNTLADINLTTITADKITAALETEPKEQYWLNGNPINSIQQKTE